MAHMRLIAGLVADERRWLVDVLGHLTDEQWQARTLCEGWTVEDLAAHLVVREREPLLAGPGIVFAPFAPLTRRLMARRVARGREHLVEALGKGPPFLYDRTLVNLAEYWIHNEDVARGDLTLDRPDPGAELSGMLWHHLRRVARLNLARVRGAEGALLLEAGDRERLALRVGRLLVRRADPATAGAELSGPAGEILLYLSGRRGAARVTLAGDDTGLVKALESSPMGL